MGLLLCKGEDEPISALPEKKSLRHPLSNFSIEDLELYTNKFSKILGKGGFGSVFEGLITWNVEKMRIIHSQKIAVKVSTIATKRIKTQWLAEIRFLQNLKHDNIIELLGYCETKDNVYLVYPLMKRKDVKTNLRGLNWSCIIKILKSAGSAIEYLHSQKPSLIYRDLKPENLLLDKDYTTKLGDFGTVTEEGEVYFCGTNGYTDPIVQKHGLATKPSDIYSFGVLILQLVMKAETVLLGGKECNEHITDWAKRQQQREGHVVHYTLLGSKGCTESSARAVTALAMECVEQDTDLRPSISVVVQRLSLLDTRIHCCTSIIRSS